MIRNQKQKQNMVVSILSVIVILTSVVAIIGVNAEQDETARTEEPICDVTTSPTVEETVEHEQEHHETEQAVTEATAPIVSLYNVPLDEGIQLYIIWLAEENGIDPSIIFAMIWKESSFNTAAVGDNGNSFGLMQIQKRWHNGLMEQLGCHDLLDPIQNVTVGIHILADHVDYYDGNIEMALIAYNAGRSGAYKHWFSHGEYSSTYSRAVMEKAEELRGDTYALF